MFDRVRADLLPPLQSLRRRLTLADVLAGLMIALGLTGYWRSFLTDPLLLGIGDALAGLTLLAIGGAWAQQAFILTWAQARMIVHRTAQMHLVRLLLALLGPSLLDAIQLYPTEALSLGIALLLVRVFIWPTPLRSH